MSEENKALVRRFLDELHNKGNYDIVDELLAPGYPGQGTGGSAVGGGGASPEAVKEGARTRSAAFPDIQWTIDDQISEGDKVVTRFTMRGTHKGEYLGIAPTNKEIVTTGIFIHRVENGKLVDRWTGFDALGMMQQLGAIPS